MSDHVPSYLDTDKLAAAHAGTTVDRDSEVNPVAGAGASDLTPGKSGLSSGAAAPSPAYRDTDMPEMSHPVRAVGQPTRVQRSIVSTIKSYVSHAVGISRDALTSSAWTYPLYGVAYIASHPKLIIPVLPLLLRSLLVSAGVVGACFFFLYLPQVAWLAIFSGPLAFTLAVPLVLAEAGIIILFLGKLFLLGPLSTDLFDAVLVQKGQEQLVKRVRPITTRENNSKQLGRLLKAPFSKLNKDNLIRSIVTLPFNFIPVVGTAFFLGYNGYKAGPTYHARYFQLKGFDKERRAAFVERRRGAYMSFGTVAMLFNMVPVISIPLSLATHVGAALWAAQIENKDAKAGEKGQLENRQDAELDVSIPRQ